MTDTRSRNGGLKTVNAEFQVKTLSDFYVGWCFYNSSTGGCCTHATPEDSNTSLCGVVMTDGAGKTVAENNSTVDCKRCQKALAKLGLLAARY